MVLSNRSGRYADPFLPSVQRGSSGPEGPTEISPVFTQDELPRRGGAKLRLSRGFTAASPKTREPPVEPPRLARTKRRCGQKKSVRPAFHLIQCLPTLAIAAAGPDESQ